MKKFLLAFALLLSNLLVMPVSAGVNDFYFSDFTADYYLTKDAEGISHLKVIENVTAEFPEHNQNKGICRQIPFTNQNGNNTTLPSLTRENLKLLRNGVAEPIYSIDREGDYYDVCTGNDDYVLGTQVYTFEYEYVKVVTEFDGFQELYWDTNGNGSSQRFDKVTARVHFEDPTVWTGDSWCYVGSYGSSGRDRCTTTRIGDGVEFEAEKLAAFENLTFDVELKDGSFVVPEPDKNYAYVWAIGIFGVLSLLVILWAIRKFAKTREKARYYKGIFVKPEYQPHATYSLPEMSELYIGKKKDVKVAMLLDLAVKKKIEFQKVDKRKWNILVKDADGMRLEYEKLLAILNGGTTPKTGDVIEVKRRTATSSLISLRASMEGRILHDLKQDELVEKDYKIGSGGKRGFSNLIAMMVVFVPTMIAAQLFVMGMLADLLGLDNGGIMVFEDEFFPTLVLMAIVTVAIAVALNDSAEKYQHLTNKGLEMARYMDGLKMYIEMAEADRMKMLQSIEEADTSAEGIVKLYEKLLPYAAVFGLEESWMNEMKEYCELEEVETPDYLLAGITAHELARGLNQVSSYATTASTMSNSGGSSSSGFSGGGGGGFSGGGGGGGGFSGR